jgi:hypothetical protein
MLEYQSMQRTGFQWKIDGFIDWLDADQSEVQCAHIWQIPVIGQVEVVIP